MNRFILYGLINNISLWILVVLLLIVMMISIYSRQRKFYTQKIEEMELRNQIQISLADMVSNCVIVLDERGDICQVNRMVERYYNQPTDQLIGKNIQRLHTDFDVSEHQNSMKVNFDLGISYSFSVNYFKSDNSVIPFDVVIQRFILREKYYYGIAARDRYWVERREKHIREQEERLAEIEAIAGMGYWEVDHQTGKVAWSRELYHLLGCEINKVKPNLDMLFSQVYPEDQGRVMMAFSAAFQNQERVNITHRLVRTDGEIIDVSVRIRHTFSPKNEHLSTIGLIQKITDESDSICDGDLYGGEEQKGI